MAKFNNVRVTYTNAVTVNTGNFQNVRPEYSISADVPDGTHPKEAKLALKALVDAWLDEDIDEIKREMNE